MRSRPGRHATTCVRQGAQEWSDDSSPALMGAANKRLEDRPTIRDLLKFERQFFLETETVANKKQRMSLAALLQ